ncbi:hypothetical protein WDU94_005644 [Cyamophila willieti]
MSDWEDGEIRGEEDNLFFSTISEVGIQSTASRPPAPDYNFPAQSPGLQGNRVQGMTDISEFRSFFKELVKSLPGQNITIPIYRPGRDVDPKSWVQTVEFCLAKRPLLSSDLILTLSNALKGPAAQWFARIVCPHLSWPEFKVLFTTEYIQIETPAATFSTQMNVDPAFGLYQGNPNSRIEVHVNLRENAVRQNLLDMKDQLWRNVTIPTDPSVEIVLFLGTTLKTAEKPDLSQNHRPSLSHARPVTERLPSNPTDLRKAATRMSSVTSARVRDITRITVPHAILIASWIESNIATHRTAYT